MWPKKTTKPEKNPALPTGNCCLPRWRWFGRLRTATWTLCFQILWARCHWIENDIVTYIDFDGTVNFDSQSCSFVPFWVTSNSSKTALFSGADVRPWFPDLPSVDIFVAPTPKPKNVAPRPPRAAPAAAVAPRTSSPVPWPIGFECVTTTSEYPIPWLENHTQWLKVVKCYDGCFWIIVWTFFVVTVFYVILFYVILYYFMLFCIFRSTRNQLDPWIHLKHHTATPAPWSQWQGCGLLPHESSV